MKEGGRESGSGERRMSMKLINPPDPLALALPGTRQVLLLLLLMLLLLQPLLLQAQSHAVTWAKERDEGGKWERNQWDQWVEKLDK